ncbi:CUB domain protein, partial [Opisthorchis viverrini]
MLCGVSTRGETRAVCITEIENATDSIASPSYPNYYPANLNYTWTISQPRGCVVRLRFEDFQLESDKDFVHVYDGPATNENLMDTWTGTRLPSPRVSTGNSLTIKMLTDSTREFRGFYATYEA